MPHLFERHLERARSHLLHAVEQLNAKEFDEGLVDLGCVLQEVYHATLRPAVTPKQVECLAAISAATLEAQSLVQLARKRPEG